MLFWKVMETIQYKLKSKPRISVAVPADYASKAQNLVELALQHPTRVEESIHEHPLEYPYLGNIGIFSRVSQLARTHPKIPESLRLQDIVYLRVCIYGNERKMRGPEREEAMRLDLNLVKLVEELEHQ